MQEAIRLTQQLGEESERASRHREEMSNEWLRANKLEQALMEESKRASEREDKYNRVLEDVSRLV